ncbi:LPS assembly lipoprotein LptE [Oryzifoliimicrobium ureilyticus]|uniref:LPS assembly lipoprotein LptE n=1 Tax=Oryzifoliimicrobium ureilyticus TaxID=3113724 RepID=UPI003076439C
MSFDVTFTLTRRVGLAVFIGAMMSLASCQVRPLYSESSGVVEKLKAVEFSAATTRIEQEVRNRLIFLASGGAGEPAKADYTVELHARSDVTETLLLAQISDDSRAGRVTVSVDYTLKSKTDGRVIKAGNRYATALVDFTEQQFAKQRAIRDGENRAAREAAELVGADIASALGR